MRKLTKRRSGTAPQNEDASLFKYVFKYGRKRQPKEPGCLYSFDRYDERERFPVGISQEQRKMWRAFLENFEDRLYDFFGNARPHFGAKGVKIYFTNTGEAKRLAESITEGIRKQIDSLALEAGFEIEGFFPVAKDAKKLPHVTPKYAPDLKSMNGLNDGRNWVFRHIVPKGVIEVQVYDNIALHDDNLVTTWLCEENLAKLSQRVSNSTPAERTVRVGDAINEFQRQAK